MSFLVLDQLTKAYGDVIAVDRLSLEVAKGEFVSLLGPSGCGKTTTLQMIAGFVEPTNGRITLDNGDLLSVRPNKRALGIVFQSYALFPHMTAAENVAFGLEMQHVPRAERDRRVAETLSLVGLSALADRFPRKMSGGQQQRVALARALVIRPRVLLLDEPLSNLDAKLREEMQIELRQIQRTLGTTTILVTHDQSEAMALSDRIVIMNRGRAEQIARPDEAYARPASEFVANFLGKTNQLAASIRETDGRKIVSIGAALWPAADAMHCGPATVAVRPERIALTANGGVPGILRHRVFHGSHWLLQVETDAGAVTIIRQNDGQALPREGEAIQLSWRAEDMSVTPGKGPDA
ncbi:MAG TPA: ABC transporter ATP-binding protein [Stellaceae bacterium]|nr:ABC transporter ATP-binding protein [Stellaceae bacterium]